MSTSLAVVAALDVAQADLASARRNVLVAGEHLAGARLVRATQLAEILADAVTLASRLRCVVESDCSEEGST
jgi:hypothetical protein